jgi:D-3-phosphoglycerate dehydrogenase
MARYLTAFDAAVAYHDPYVADASYPRWSLEDIFAGSDAVCVCCALTPETTGMIGFGLLASLRPNACLVNTARGEIIVEADLARLLQERPDVRVGLDVLAGEVVGAHHQSPLLPFQREGRVAITPHIAGATLESQTKAAVGALRLLGRHLPTAALVGARGGAA